MTGKGESLTMKRRGTVMMGMMRMMSMRMMRRAQNRQGLSHR